MRKRICVVGLGAGGFHYALERLIGEMPGDFDLVLVYAMRSQAQHNWRSGAPVHRAYAVRSPSVTGDWWLTSMWWSLVAFWRALAILVTTQPDCLLSVGSALAVPFGAAARVMRVPLFFVESMTRIKTPSRTGRLIQRLCLARRHYVQWPTLENDSGLTYAGAVSRGLHAVNDCAQLQPQIFGFERRDR